MRMRFNQLASVAAAVLAVTLALPAQAATDEVKTVVNPVPGTTLNAGEMAKGLTAIVDNVALAVKGIENFAANSQAWDKAKSGYDQQLTDSRNINANRDMRMAASVDYMNDNRAPRSQLAQYGSLYLTATIANGLTRDFMSKTFEQFDQVSRTSKSASTAVKPESIIAEACQAGCVSPEEAEAISSTGITCKSDPEVAGSWTNPELLRRLVATKGCIPMDSRHKATQCLAAFRHLMALGDDFPRNDRGRTPQGRSEIVKVALEKASTANVSDCMTMQLQYDVCLPKSAVSDPAQYQDRSTAASKYGITCGTKITGQGYLPSQSCQNQLSQGLLRGAYTSIPQEWNASPTVINGQGLQSMQIAEQLRQGSVSAQSQSQSCNLMAMQRQYEKVQAYFSRPDVQTYMASAEFVEKVKIIMAELPARYRKIELAMADYSKNYLYPQEVPSMGQIAFNMTKGRAAQPVQLAKAAPQPPASPSLSSLFSNAAISLPTLVSAEAAGVAGQPKAIPISTSSVLLPAPQPLADAR
ncbi:MAG TPA: hypothetical protein VHB73_06540 [Alphaproteobacteria bacterium]|nr:hypothetical protein [Alphaproteobacteria bacterium]